jgi:hypothetical protein
MSKSPAGSMMTMNQAVLQVISPATVFTLNCPTAKDSLSGHKTMTAMSGNPVTTSFTIIIGILPLGRLSGGKRRAFNNGTTTGEIVARLAIIITAQDGAARVTMARDMMDRVVMATGATAEADAETDF